MPEYMAPSAPPLLMGDLYAATEDPPTSYATQYEDLRLLGGMKVGDYKAGLGSYVATSIQWRFPENSYVATVCSTSRTSRKEMEGEKYPYLYDDIWVGEEDMEAFPQVRYSECRGSFLENFAMSTGRMPVSIMEWLEEQHKSYIWCWTGYHIHKEEVSSVNAAYCPVDIYLQKSMDRRRDADKYEHWIAVDVVAPSMVHESRDMKYHGFKTVGGYYM